MSTRKDPDHLPLIKVVGVSGSGKSTLVSRLRLAGYNARPISQEHSAIPNLWEQFDAPAALIFLYANLASQRLRRADVNWSKRDLSVELQRLAHAREGSDLRIDTSDLSIEEVFRLVGKYLEHIHMERADYPLLPVPPTGSSHTRSPK